MGSNIGDRKEYLCKALTILSLMEKTRIEEVSSVYETEPVEYLQQPDFLNIACRIDTKLSPEELLSGTQMIESILGRKRLVRFGPRTIDIDLLLFEDAVIQTDKLTVPHPRMYDRAFVLIPLQEVKPDLSVSKEDMSGVRLFGSIPENCWLKAT